MGAHVLPVRHCPPQICAFGFLLSVAPLFCMFFLYVAFSPLLSVHTSSSGNRVPAPRLTKHTSNITPDKPKRKREIIIVHKRNKNLSPAADHYCISIATEPRYTPFTHCPCGESLQWPSHCSDSTMSNSCAASR